VVVELDAFDLDPAGAESAPDKLGRVRPTVLARTLVLDGEVAVHDQHLRGTRRLLWKRCPS
jgi:hypothetical protein